MSAPLFLFFLIIQLTGSAPSVSNFASYSGVLMVMVRCGAALTFGVGSGAGGAAAAVSEPGVCVAVGLAAGEAVVAGSWFGGGGAGYKKFHKTRIAEEIIKASKSRFCCISY